MEVRQGNKCPVYVVDSDIWHDTWKIKFPGKSVEMVRIGA